MDTTTRSLSLSLAQSAVLRGELLIAHGSADAVSSIILSDLIGRAATLENDIKRLIAARNPE